MSWVRIQAHHWNIPSTLVVSVVCRRLCRNSLQGWLACIKYQAFPRPLLGKKKSVSGGHQPLQFKFQPEAVLGDIDNISRMMLPRTVWDDAPLTCEEIRCGQDRRKTRVRGRSQPRCSPRRESGAGARPLQSAPGTRPRTNRVVTNGQEGLVEAG